MIWQRVADDLRATADDAGRKAEALRKLVTTAINDPVNIERIKTIERHKINGNICMALAQALEAGIE